MEGFSIIEEIEKLRLQEPLQDANYYFITLLGTHDGRVRQIVDTMWVGFTETKPRREVRKASLVHPGKLRSLLSSLGQVSYVINNIKDLSIYVLIGGNGVIEKSLAEQYFSNLIAPRPVLRSYSNAWIDVGNRDELPARRAPTQKLRMEVIKRDKLRCRICGRAPKDYEDLELHVHHILPWGDGGSTEAENLITLCHTCHSGLHPHYDEVLFTLIDVNMLDKARAERTEFTEGVLRYRKIIRDRLNKTRKK